jgi:predicted membrane protein
MPFLFLFTDLIAPVPEVADFEAFATVINLFLFFYIFSKIINKKLFYIIFFTYLYIVMNKDMNKKEKEALVNSLQVFLDESERMWKEGKPHAQIVGYLQGTVKTVINHLKD